mmetsp:Transcript_12745/g.40695  ORF Transcript_12745/g.40695 Transcript_12745/m.40695 type:complete len:229 (-) Transcript_12745:647-1333(-)
MPRGVWAAKTRFGQSYESGSVRGISSRCPGRRSIKRSIGQAPRSSKLNIRAGAESGIPHVLRWRSRSSVRSTRAGPLCSDMLAWTFARSLKRSAKKTPPSTNCGSSQKGCSRFSWATLAALSPCQPRFQWTLSISTQKRARARRRSRARSSTCSPSSATFMIMLYFTFWTRTASRARSSCLTTRKTALSTKAISFASSARWSLRSLNQKAACSSALLAHRTGACTMTR